MSDSQEYYTEYEEYYKDTAKYEEYYEYEEYYKDAEYEEFEREYGTGNEDENMNEEETEDKDGNRAEDTTDDETTIDGETTTDGEDEARAEDETRARDEARTEDEDEDEGEDESEDEDEGEDGDETRTDDCETRAEVPIQRNKRGTRSIRSRLRNNGNSKSSVWKHFNTKTTKYPGRPVCSKCKRVFSAATSTSTLRRHLKIHKVVAPKQRQKTIDDYRTDPHSPNEQEERDRLVANWVVCDIQPFRVVKCEEWRKMIAKFDPRYQFHNRHSLKENIVSLFEEKLEIVKLVVQKIPGKVAFTSDM